MRSSKWHNGLKTTLIIIMLQGCSPKKIHTVEQFINDEILRLDYFKKCMVTEEIDPKEQTCLNVMKATDIHNSKIIDDPDKRKCYSLEDYVNKKCDIIP